MPHQAEAIEKLDTGKVLVGGTGSGKSITALAYAARKHPTKRIVVLTTAKKRDSGEWFGDAMKMSLRQDLDVDSWNNISKYEGVKDAFFIFDEQRVVGSGAWVESFYKICAANPWLLLSATPADSWMDLVPIFIANGFYRNKTHFNDEHVRWARFVKYPKVDGYLDVWTLGKHRESVYVEMPYLMKHSREEHMIEVDFDLDAQKMLYVARWNAEENRPLKDAGEMTRLMRLSANLHPSRYEKLKEIIAEKRKVIVFYNRNPELEQLRLLMTELDIPVAEWNGHVHQDVPTGDDWVYLVQYQAGGEGWNCTTTDTVVFYSLPYSYRNLEQAKGRIDRLNTPYETLHYYIFKSRAIIDQAIWKSLTRKKNFQASAFGKRRWEKAEASSKPLIDKFAA
jgi:hypothetical protein